MESEFPARKEPKANKIKPNMKNLFLPFLSENFPKTGMKEASIKSDTSGTQITTLIGALRFMEITGSMKIKMPVSSGGTKFPMLTARSEDHLRRGETCIRLPTRVKMDVLKFFQILSTDCCFSTAFHIFLEVRWHGSTEIV